VEPRAFAGRVADEIAAVLGTDLVGVYLHGSAALGSFNPDRSDIDLIVVVKQPADEARKAALAQLLLIASNRPYPLEVSVIDETSLRPWRHPARFDFHFAEGWRERIEHALERRPFELEYSRTNKDLAAELAALRERGECLRGAMIAEVFPEIPASDVLDSISSDLRWAAENGRDVYGVLNACRALAFLAEGAFLSKAEAARWALERLSDDDGELVEHALGVYEGREGTMPDADGVWTFVVRTRARVDRAAATSES
jgi:predicted nucleotidyltransferase